MADLYVSVPENSQNVVDIATTKTPLERVFEAFTDETLFAKWWCRGNPMKVHRFECRDGGSWHIDERTGDGKKHELLGSFHEVATNERIIQTFESLGMPERGHVFLQRSAFVGIDANTTEIHTITTAQSQEERDGMVSSGIEGGWHQSVESLGRLLEA